MDSEKLNQAINLDTEIVELRDILNAAGEKPHLEFLFTGTSRETRGSYTVKSEALVHQILCDLTQRKLELEAEFKAL